MDNLSIVIRDTEDKIYEHVECLKPLLEDNKAHLVLINNNTDKFDLPFQYTLYEFSEGYSKFKTFYKSVCLYENILLIEKGMKLNKEIINIIKECANKNMNLFIKVKKFIDKNKKNYIIHEFNILSNDNSKGCQYLDSQMAEDLSLINFNLEDIQANLFKLADTEQYKVIFQWYEAWILEDKRSYEEKFFEELENLKNNLNIEGLDEVNKLFIMNIANNKYKSYLIIISLYEEKREWFEKRIQEILCAEDFNERNMYLSNFVKLLFKEKEYCLEIIKYIEINVLDAYMKHLLEIDNSFYLDVYNFIMSIDLGKEVSIDNNKRVITIMNVLKTYINYMGDKSADAEKKNILVQIFLDYANYGMYLLKQSIKIQKSLVSDEEVKFLIEIYKVVEYINSNQIIQSINILRRAGEEFQLMTMPVRYYTQQLIRENNMYPYKLSICIMAKNEEKFLDKCLSSIKPLLDEGIAELIFVDTGSTDKTVEIANKYVDKVYHKMWQDNFSKMRNYSISLANGEYIFIMDADYEVEKGDIDKIISFFKGEEYSKYKTLLINIKNFTDEKYISFSAMTQTLIFKNDGEFYYKGNVHNQPICKGPFKFLDVTILHYGYIMTEDIKDKKFFRTAKILLKELQKDPKRIYYRMQLSASYSMHGDKEKALEQVKIYMKDLEQQGDITKDNLMPYNNAMLLYLANGLYDDTIDVCDRALKKFPDFIDFIYNKATALYYKKNYQETIPCIMDYLSLLKEINEHAILKDHRYIFYSLDCEKKAIKTLLVCYHEIKNYKSFFELLNNLDEEEIIKNSLYLIINTFFELKKYKELALFYNDKIFNSKDNDLKIYFNYLLISELRAINDSRKDYFYSIFTEQLIDKTYTGAIKCVENNEEEDGQFFNFINEYDLEEVDIVTAKMLIDKILPVLNNHKISNLSNINEIVSLKKCSFFILDKSLNTKQFFGLSKGKLLDVLNKYIYFSMYLFDERHRDHLNNKEIKFIKNIISSFDNLQKGDLLNAVRFIKDGVVQFNEMARPMELYLETIIPGYEANLEYIKDKENDELRKYANKIKITIIDLVNTNQLVEAKELIDEYEKIITDDLEITSIRAIILIIENNLEKAEMLLKDGLAKDSNNFDLLYNLAYLHERKNNITEATSIYNIARLVNDKVELTEMLDNKISQIEKFKVKYNVVLFGEYNACSKFKNRFFDWNIVSICNDKIEKETMTFPELKKYKYDFIFVLGNIDKEKVYEKFKRYNDKNIYFMEDFRTSIIEGLDYKILRLTISKNEIDGIITGLSYAEVGIKENLLPYNFMNFAFSAQDLYYDFFLLKYLLHFKEVKNSLKYVIINLGYYSFDYDMSNTIAKYRIHRYVKYLNKYHNNNDIIGVDITRTLYEKRVTFKDYINMNKSKENSVLKINDINGIYEAKRNSSMDYEKTRRENENILDDYLSFLEENNIRPVIVVCPTSSYYREYFDNYKKITFYNILNKLNEKHNFQVIDYFESDLFEDDDFWDYSHLNGKGSKKFTKILSQEIRWRGHQE